MRGVGPFSRAWYKGPVTLLALILVMSVQAAGGAGPAAPSVQDELLAAINRGDPEMTATPAPVAELVAAGELAGRALVHAEMEEVSELLGYLHVALELAYRRTGDPAHLEAEIDALGPVLARPELTHELTVRATRWRDAACSSLVAVHGRSGACATPQASSDQMAPSETPVMTPVRVERPAEVLMSVPRPRPASTPRADARRPGRGLVIAGGVMLSAGVAITGAAGYLGHRMFEAKREYFALHDMVDGLATTDQDTMAGALLRDYRGMVRPTIALAVAGGVTIVVAAVLAGVGGRRMARAASRTAIVPVPGGLALHARF
jgi:hypothetical protein